MSFERPRQHLLLGAAFIIVAELSFASMGIGIHFVAHELPNASIVFYFALTAALISGIPLAWSWQLPSAAAFGWLFAIALFATLGQVCLTNGLSLAPAARVGTFGYFAVVFGATYGLLLWDKIPT